MVMPLLALLGSGATIAIAFFARVDTYRVAPAFLVPAIWAPWFFRRGLHLHPLHFALWVAAVLLHNLGAFELYQRNVGYGLLRRPFDNYVHFYFGMVIALITHRALAHHLHWRALAHHLATLSVVMALGALHEVMEYGSTLLLGEQRGMVKTGTYPFDTSRDLLNNLLGTLLAFALYAASRSFWTPGRTSGAGGASSTTAHRSAAS
jgi:uncharacterized membrane protein YjdF